MNRLDELRAAIDVETEPTKKALLERQLDQALSADEEAQPLSGGNGPGPKNPNG